MARKKLSKKEQLRADRKAALNERHSTEVDNRDRGNAPSLPLKGISLAQFKPEEGKNHINILPYIVGSNSPQGTKKDMLDYKLDIWIHKRVGPKDETVICTAKTFGKSCYICEQLEKLRDEGEASDGELNALKPKRNCIYIVEDIKNKVKEKMIWMISHWLFEKEMFDEAEADTDADGERITPADLDDGRSIKFRASKEKFEKGSYFKFKSFNFLTRKPISDEILESLPSLDDHIVVLDYKEVKSMFLGGMEEEEDDEDEEATYVEDEEDDEEDNLDAIDLNSGEEEDTEEEEVDEDEDELEEEDEESCPEGHDLGLDYKQEEECDECSKADRKRCRILSKELKKRG